MTSARVVTTAVVAPLGTVAVVANFLVSQWKVFVICRLTVCNTLPSHWSGRVSVQGERIWCIGLVG